MSSPGNCCLVKSSRSSSSTSSSSSSSSIASTLFKYTTIAGTSTWRASRMCSLRLRHRPVGRAHHQDSPVHLRRPSDHVLDVVRMPRAVHVRVVPVVRLVLHVRDRYRDPSRPLLGRVVDRVERPVLRLPFIASTFVIAAVSVVFP